MWSDKKKFYTTDRARASRLFRYHVVTKYNPRGRIHRMICQWCPPNAQITLSQFHHVNYAFPFVGVWVCCSCHRKIEAGSISITVSKLCDYTELVRPILRPAISAALRAFHADRDFDATGTDSPF
jgi:hypothetical protein